MFRIRIGFALRVFTRVRIPCGFRFSKYLRTKRETFNAARCVRAARRFVKHRFLPAAQSSRRDVFRTGGAGPATAVGLADRILSILITRALSRNISWLNCFGGFAAEFHRGATGTLCIDRRYSSYPNTNVSTSVRLQSCYGIRRWTLNIR